MSMPHQNAAALPGETLSEPVRAFRLTLALAQNLRTLMDRRLSPDGITTQQAALLTVTEVLGQPAMSEAARTLGTSHQNVKQLASALARKGLVEIVPDRADARSKRLRLTKKHYRLWGRRNPNDHACVARWFSGLTAGEIMELVTLLSKALASVRANG